MNSPESFLKKISIRALLICVTLACVLSFIFLLFTIAGLFAFGLHDDADKAGLIVLIISILAIPIICLLFLGWLMVKSSSRGKFFHVFLLISSVGIIMYGLLHLLDALLPDWMTGHFLINGIIIAFYEISIITPLLFGALIRLWQEKRKVGREKLKTS